MSATATEPVMLWARKQPESTAWTYEVRQGETILATRVLDPAREQDFALLEQMRRAYADAEEEALAEEHLLPRLLPTTRINLRPQREGLEAAIAVLFPDVST